jgi:hypothetical protein
MCFRGLQQGVASGGHLAQAWADGHNQIGIANTLRQTWTDANAHITGIQRVVVVERILKAECIGHRQVPVFGKALQRLRGLRCPTTATRE